MKIFYPLLLFSFSSSFSLAQIDSSKINDLTEEEEYNLKADFLYNFTQYIEWQTSDAEEDFIIGVIGESPIIEPLEDIAKTKTMEGKRIVIREITNPDEIGFCHILFISKSNTFPIGTILTKVSQGMLTISEKKGAAQEGVTINFVIINDKLKFEANIQAISNAGLKASSELLKLAVIVTKN